MFRYLMIYLLKTINSNRSPAAIYHILTGKKSSQTIQDLHLFQLHTYYRLLPNLSRQAFDYDVDQMVNEGLMEWLNAKDYRLTDKADAYLSTYKDTYDDAHNFEQPVDHQSKEIFTKRFYLTIQTFTHRVMDDTGFIPLIDDITIQAFVKQYYHLHKHALVDWLERCYEQLHDVLKTYPDIRRHIYLDRLSTANHNGQSLQQLVDRYHVTEADILLTLALIERTLFIRSQQHQTLLSDLLPADNQPQIYERLMTRSARKTHQLVIKGYNIEDLIQLRQLKRGTIEDHLVEICMLDDHFKLDDYVEEEKIAIIESYLSKRHTQKLAELKRTLPEEMTYLDLRLVFAHYQKRLHQ